MARNLPVSEETSLLKSVQEMSMNGDEPPPQFLVKETNSFGSLPKSVQELLMNGDEPPPQFLVIPIIDVSLLSSEDELEKLRSALSSAGCFQAINHGMTLSFLNKVREVSKQFFALPEEEKQKYARAVNEHQGYGQDRILPEKQVLDWSYRLTLKVLPTDKRRLNFWPENPTDFSEVLDEFSTNIKSTMDYLLKSMARSLNLEEGCFLNQFGERASMNARFNFYPRCSRPDLVLGFKPHTDRSGISVLLQDTEVEGLQVLIDNKWVNVPTIPDALVVILGDQMQIMSNGIFKSPTHRVVTNTEKLRVSVAMLNEPDRENEVGPVEALIDETRPRLYRNVRGYGDINYKCYQEGKKALETVQVQVGDHTV